ncbi:MAG: manganese efflux pump MntP family protein [Candidatus Cloacimonetes bacterium]|nr:manganese efflux pump MntP family protein [Candidatus Cloacimonadota bacterium]
MIAVALSIDAFSIAICLSLSVRNHGAKDALTVATYFGFFQAFMPVIGYFIGSFFSGYIADYGHWVVSAILFFIGGKIIAESILAPKPREFSLKIMFLLTLAIATSLDAFAVGISFAFTDINIYYASVYIGMITFLISVIGVKIGIYCSKKLSNWSEMIAGIVLIALGLKALIEHLW